MTGTIPLRCGLDYKTISQTWSAVKCEKPTGNLSISKNSFPLPTFTHLRLRALGGTSSHPYCTAQSKLAEIARLHRKGSWYRKLDLVEDQTTSLALWDERKVVCLDHLVMRFLSCELYLKLCNDSGE